MGRLYLRALPFTVALISTVSLSEWAATVDENSIERLFDLAWLLIAADVVYYVAGAYFYAWVFRVYFDKPDTVEIAASFTATTYLKVFILVLVIEESFELLLGYLIAVSEMFGGSSPPSPAPLAVTVLVLIFFAIRFSFVLPALIAERSLGINTSWRITGDAFFRTALLLSISFLIAVIPVVLVMEVLSLFLSSESEFLSLVLAAFYEVLYLEGPVTFANISIFVGFITLAVLFSNLAVVFGQSIASFILGHAYEMAVAPAKTTDVTTSE